MFTGNSSDSSFYMSTTSHISDTPSVSLRKMLSIHHMHHQFCLLSFHQVVKFVIKEFVLRKRVKMRRPLLTTLCDSNCFMLSVNESEFCGFKIKHGSCQGVFIQSSLFMPPPPNPIPPSSTINFWLWMQPISTWSLVSKSSGGYHFVWTPLSLILVELHVNKRVLRRHCW